MGFDECAASHGAAHSGAAAFGQFAASNFANFQQLAEFKLGYGEELWDSPAAAKPAFRGKALLLMLGSLSEVRKCLL